MRPISIGQAPASIISSPLDYPFEVWRSCFALGNGEAAEVPIASLPLNDLGNYDAVAAAFRVHAEKDFRAAFSIKNPIGLLSCGSNASPHRLAEKLARSHDGGTLGVRVTTRAYVPCYGATLSYYGSVPATFAAGGTNAFPFLIITDASNLEAMIESETRTGNYDLYRSSEDNQHVAAGMPVYAFVCRFGSIKLDGDICRLSEFQMDPGTCYSQRQIMQRLLRELGYPLTPDQFVAQMADRSSWAELREKIRGDFGSMASLKGFERVG